MRAVNIAVVDIFTLKASSPENHGRYVELVAIYSELTQRQVRYR